MKFKLLLIVFFLIAVFGGFGLYTYQKKLSGNEAVNHDITNRLLIIDGLDSKVNESALRNRYNLDNNYDRLARSSSLLNKSIEDMKNTYFKETDVNANLVHRKFKDLRNELEIKKDLIENFKSHNSVLKNSQRYAPVVGKNLILIAEKENLPSAAKLYSEVTIELLEYSLLSSTTSAEKLNLILPKLLEIEKLMPEYALSASIEFMNHVNTVIKEKNDTDKYLSKALTSATNSRISDLSEAWKEQLLENGGKHEK
jgi:hypothetical protein